MQYLFNSFSFPKVFVMELKRSVMESLDVKVVVLKEHI